MFHSHIMWCMQLLKLACGLTIQTPYYLITDTDTVFLRPLEALDLLEQAECTTDSGVCDLEKQVDRMSHVFDCLACTYPGVFAHPDECMLHFLVDLLVARTCVPSDDHHLPINGRLGCLLVNIVRPWLATLYLGHGDSRPADPQNLQSHRCS